MSRESTATTARERRPPTADDPGDEPNALLNAAVGAAATVVTAPLLPFAAIVGGGLAGYLQRGTLAEGAKVGALSGVVAAVPAALIAWVVVGMLFLGGFMAISAVAGAVIFALIAGYLVGAGALGGALGSYVRREL